MSRTGIDGDQVQDESLTGDDILDGSVGVDDINTGTVGKALITKVLATGGLEMESYTGADEGTGIVTLKAAAGGFGGDFYSEFDASENSTTSGGWVNKINDTTDALTKDGNYIIIYSMEMGQTKKQKQVGSLVRFRIKTGGSNGPWTTISDIRDGLSNNNVFQLRTGIYIIEGLTAGQKIQVQMRYGQIDDGGTGKIKNAGFISWRVSDGV